MGKKKPRDGFLSSNLSKFSFDSTSPSSSSSKKDSNENSNHKEFKSYVRDVVQFGGASLKGQQKQDTKKLLLADTGRKLPKNQKVPYKMLQGILKKKRETTKGNRNSSHDAVLPSTSSASKRRERTIAKGSRGIKETIGKYHKGMLVLSKADIRSVQSKKTRSSKK